MAQGHGPTFISWTDHKKLVYLQSAKLLNPRQARWTLFFTGFHFSITYRPGSHYVKPDGLSQLVWLGPSLRTQLTLHPSCNLPTPLGPLHGKLSHRSKKHRPLACLCLLYKISGGLEGLWSWRTLLDFAVSGSGQNQALRVPPLHPDKNDGSPAGSHLSSGGTVMVPCVSPGMSLLSGVCGRRRVCPPTPPPPPPFHSHFVYGTWWLCK